MGMTQGERYAYADMGNNNSLSFETSKTPAVKPQKIYPNDPCPCGSGKKYKKCCGRGSL